MAKLTEEMKELINGQLCFIATVNADGSPNIGPKGSTRVLDDEHIVYGEVTGRQHWANVQRNRHVAVACVNRETRKNCRIDGTAEIVTSGPVFDEVQGRLKARNSVAKAVIKIKVDRISSL
ncbi:MAG: pyridoxamine 5'-phosphate oxidase family protein [Chloroflexi bacterium]|nr:pyridoxamine 5'-phosphate oxidase family protein [Chloroflexota bacterium]